MKYSELNKYGLIKLSRIEECSIKILWIKDFYDGPLESICELNSEMHLSKLFLENEGNDFTPWCRRYVLLRLSEQQKNDEIYWHEEFKKFVGNHGDQTPKEQAKGAINHPSIIHEKFYTNYKEKYKPNWSDNEVIGWYET